ARQQGADLHLRIVPHFTEGTARVADPKGGDPPGQRRINAQDNRRGRGGTPTANDVAYRGFDSFPGLLLWGHQEVISLSGALPAAAQVNPEAPKGFPLQCIDQLRLLRIQYHPEREKLFLEPWHSSLRPPPLPVVTTDGDDHILGEPMVVDRLIGARCRLAPAGVKSPIDLVQIDMRRQGAARAALRHPYWPTNGNALFDAVHDRWVLDSFRPLVQQYRVSNRVEVARQINIDHRGHPPQYTPP